MRKHQTDYLITDENAIMEIALFTTIGNREQQQDCAGMRLKNREGLIIVCDGMGGHKGGQIASEMATEYMLRRYAEDFPCDHPRSWLLDVAAEADLRIAAISDENGEALHAGSTVVAAYISEKSLYWLSVGDSRLYIFRDGELVRATMDHNYLSVLNLQLKNGESDEKSYNAQIAQGEALVSFLGVNGLPYFESNDIPFELKSADRLLLATDGLYKLISDSGIQNIISNFTNTSEAVNALEMKARRCAHNISRDNMTVALINVK